MQLLQISHSKLISPMFFYSIDFSTYFILVFWVKQSYYICSKTYRAI